MWAIVDQNKVELLRWKRLLLAWNSILTGLVKNDVWRFWMNGGSEAGLEDSSSPLCDRGKPRNQNLALAAPRTTGAKRGPAVSSTRSTASFFCKSSPIHALHVFCVVIAEGVICTSTNLKVLWHRLGAYYAELHHREDAPPIHVRS